MLYVQQSLSDDEELIHVGAFHWMYTFKAIMSIVWGVVLAILILCAAVYIQPFLDQKAVLSPTWTGAIKALHPGIHLFSFLMFVMGLFRFTQLIIIKISTEVAVTSSRLVYKRGLVARHVGEMAIDRIEGVNILQGVIGRMLGYGRVAVRGMGVGEVVLPPLDQPIKFRRAIETAKSVNSKKARGKA
jgi:uncharacterized membrane protein YdbT with pleckstrin-like domain